MSETYGTFATAYVEAMRLRLSALEPENKHLAARVAELEARCKRMEKAGDNLDSSIACGCGVDGPCRTCMRALEFWKQAKEAKP